MKKRSRNKSHLPFRLNLLFFVVFLLLATLVAQLGYLQIINGAKFQAEVARTDTTIVSGNVPRGVVYDAKGRILVGNRALNAITYTKSLSVKTSTMLATAKRLTTYISVSTTSLTRQDIADYYLTQGNHSKEVLQKLPKRQKVDANNQALSDSTIYKNQSRYVLTKIKPKLSHREKETAVIFAIMNGAYQLSTVFVKDDDVTQKEVAEVSEHLADMPGVGVGNNWVRNYPNGKSMVSILGTVSTEKQGLPADQINSLLAAGYSRNDRVGVSYLEKEYESILKGSKSQTQIDSKSNSGELSKIVKYAGQSGSSLNLTIDSQYQNDVQKALESVFKTAENQGATKYSSGAYAVAMNPNTGAVLAMAGIQHDPKTGKDTTDALGTINRTFVMGSAVKGAMVLGAMMDGVISPTNNSIEDVPIYLPATPVKKSVYPIGTFSSLTAPEALEVSSNIYMMRLAMKEAKASYIANKYISMSNNIFTKMRGYFSEFGLGQKTGIDLPGEVTGFKGSTHNSDGQLKTGSVLDLSYGNYDAYSLIQMVQYISTIANGGYRLKPYLVQSIARTNANNKSSQILYQQTPTVLNQVPFTKSELDVVKEGLWDVVHGTNAWGTAHTLKDVKPAIAAKTGTAQTFYFDPDNPNTTDPPETINASFVGYAPAKNPKLAIAIIFPNLTSEEGHYNLLLAKQMVQDYFKYDQSN